MQESTKTALLVTGSLDEEVVKRVVAAVETAPPADRVRAGLRAMIEVAETDPAAARSALVRLRADHQRLGRLEAWLGGDPARATFGLGAAIQVAGTELGSQLPDLDAVAPTLLRWLEGDW